MKLTTIFLLTGITALAPLVASGAERPAAPGASMQQLQQSLRELGLSEDQQTKLRAFFTENAEKLRGLREDPNLSNEQKLAKFQEFQTGFRAKAKEVLTAEQFAQLEKSRAASGAGGGGAVAAAPSGRAENAPKRPGAEAEVVSAATEAPAAAPAAGGDFRERMQRGMAELNLSAEQQEKVRAATQEMMEAMKPLREDQSLSREDKLAKFQALQEKLSAEMKVILTAEQFAKWEKQRGSLAESLRRRKQN